MCARSESGKRLKAVVASLSAAVDRLQQPVEQPQPVARARLPRKKEVAA